MSNVNVNLLSPAAQSSNAKTSSLKANEDTKSEFKHLFQSNVDKTASNKVANTKDENTIDNDVDKSVEKKITKEGSDKKKIESEDESTDDTDGVKAPKIDNDDEEPQDAQAVMSQGNELLARLNVANNALKGKVAQTNGADVALSSKKPTGQAVSVEHHLAANDSETKAELSVDSEAKASLFKKLIQLEPQAIKEQATHELSASQLAQTLLSKSKDKPIAPLQDGQLLHGLSTQQNTQANQVQATGPSIHQTSMHLNKEMADQQMAEKVQIMMSKNLKNLDIRLDPPELGRMHIRLTMNNDIAHVHITVHNPQAREMVENTLPRLREMLADQGIVLDQGSVSQQSEQQAQDNQQTHSHQHHSNVDDDPESGSVIDTVVTEPDGSINYFA